MSRVVTETYTTNVLNPTGYTGATSLSANTQYPYTNGQNSTSNTSSYARINPSSTNTDGYIYYTFTIPTIPDNATITSIAASFRARFSNGSGVTGSGQLYANTTAKGSATSVSGTTSTIYNISSTGSWSVSEVRNLRLRVNARKTNSSRYLYFYGADVTISYSINKTLYEITVSSVDSGGTVSPMSGEVEEGEDYVLTFAPNTPGLRPYKVLDNNVDVTNQLVASGGVSSYTVTTASGASYGFTQSGDSWVSSNKGISNSASVSIITLDIRNNATVTINATASSEASYDYCYLSNIGDTFSTSASNESTYKWRGAGTDSSTVSYGTLAPGTYQIYAKYYKDAYTDSNNDTFTFKVNISESSSSGDNFTYTLSNVQADHTLTVEFNPPVQYTISGTIDSSLSISPTLPQSIIEGDSQSFSITPTLPGTITVNDNNVVTATYTVPLGNLNPHTYTISNIQAAHTLNITFTELSKYNITGSVNSHLTVSPTLPQTRYLHESIAFIITPDMAGTITIVDNNVVADEFIIPPDNVGSVSYQIADITSTHTLSFQFTPLPKYTISGTIVSGLSISPTLPVEIWAGEDQSFTITPTAPGTIRVEDNGVETAVYPIPRNNVQPVTYALTDLEEHHVLAITFEALQQYQISGTVGTGLSISPTLPQSVYTGEDIDFTITPSSAGTIKVYDNGVETGSYAIPRNDIHSVTHSITGVVEAHVLELVLEPVQQYTVSGTVGSGLSISPTLPQTLYTGDDLSITITPSAAGIIRVVDNGAETAVFELPLSDVNPVVYHINNIDKAHTLSITHEALPTFTIEAVVIASGISLSPTLPITATLGETKTITITPNAAGQITVIDNEQEVAIHYILPEDVHSVTYTLSNIAADHGIEIKFSELPEFTATATLTGSGSLSPSSKTDYAGRDVTFTVSNVPSSNILIITNNGENVSDKAVKSGTTYTYTFTLIRETVVKFTSKVPVNVNVTATIDEFGTVDPATTTVQEGSSYTLQITPQDYQSTATKPLSVSDNYEEVVDQLVARKDTTSSTLTAASSTYTSLSSSNRTLWANAVGKTAESPSTTSTSANSYSSGNGTTGTITYTFNFSSIPSDAVITGVSCRAYGHAESTTMNDTRFCRIQLNKSGTAVGSYGQYSATSNSILAIPDCGTWTRSELDNLTFVVSVGYYGGMIYGISLVIEYELNQTRYYYTTTVYEEKTINVKYKPDFYVKVKSQWIGRTLTSMLPKIGGLRKHVKKLYVKIGGVWKSVD